MNYFIFRYNLFKLQHEKNKEVKILSRKMKDAKKEAKSTGDREVIDKTYHTERIDLDIVEEEIAFLMTNYLRDKAEKMLIPFIPFSREDDNWRQSMMTGRYFLTDKGIAEARKLIRQETKERLEIVAHWASIFIGAIGALIGLFAIILD